MKKYCLFLLISLFGLTLSGGENLLINAEFAADQTEFPPFWVGKDPGIRYHRTGGPDGGSFIEMKSLSGKGVSIRQAGLHLVPEEKYRLAGYFRTRGLGKLSGFLIINDGWGASCRIEKIPRDTGGRWEYAEQEVTMIPSKSGYSAILYLAPTGGSFDAADLKLIPLSTKSQEESRSILEGRTAGLVPLGYLQRIPSFRPELECRWTGRMNSDRTALEFVWSFGSPEQTLSAPFGDGNVTLRFPGLKAGQHTVTVKLIDRTNSKNIWETTYPITIIERRLVTDEAKALNNLVSEIYDGQVKADETLTVSKAGDGWVYIRFRPETTGNGKIELDGKMIVTAATVRGEAVRLIGGGEHRLTVHGAAGHLTVRSIPDIFNYPSYANPTVSGNGKYDWAFMKKFVLGAITTLNGGSMSPEETKEAKAAGLIRLGNFNVWKTETRDVGELLGRMEKAPGMTSGLYQGMTVDEISYASPGDIDIYSEVLRKFSNPKNKLIYTWIIGMPTQGNIDFISTATNVSGGRGRLLWEAYHRGQTTEDAAIAYLNRAARTAAAYRKIVPELFGSVSVILGNFNQLPLLSLNHDPGVDYKYYLDMQCQMLANAPEYRGLSGVGYWGTHYADEEIARWSFRLMRHYAIEGQTESLAKRYNYRYRPDHLLNGDFAEGLKHWQATDSVRIESQPGYGELQRRWGGSNNLGDTFAVLPAKTKLVQPLNGLEAGKLYSTGLIAVDYDDLKNNRIDPRQLPVEILVDGAEIIPEKSYCFVDNRKKVHRSQAQSARTNIHRLVFRAKSDRVTLHISTAAAPEGSQTAVNYVYVNPYFAEEAFQ